MSDTMTARSFLATALSRTGGRFHALCEVDEDGLSILTRGEHGYASAHRAIARKVIGKPIDLVMRTGYVSSAGEELAISTWKAVTRA